MSASSDEPGAQRVIDPASVCVVIPCYNEAATIGRVVTRFREMLPGAAIIVVDNASQDDTAEVAREAGARIIRESRQGKGYALLTGFAAATETNAAYYVMVDGDDTYPAREVYSLLEASAEQAADMVIGNRLDNPHPEAFRSGHTLGNHFFVFLARALFGIRTGDLFSGYRVLTRRFLETAPLVAQGFEIEAEISVQAHLHGFRVVEVPVEYRPRPERSESKLRTLRDGYQILAGLLIFFRDFRPLVFFGGIAAVLLVLSLASGYGAVDEYLRTGLVNRLPRAVLAAALFILSALSALAGVLLSSINRRAAELAALIRKRPT